MEWQAHFQDWRLREGARVICLSVYVCLSHLRQFGSVSAFRSYRSLLVCSFHSFFCLSGSFIISPSVCFCACTRLCAFLYSFHIFPHFLQHANLTKNAHFGSRWGITTANLVITAGFCAGTNNLGDHSKSVTVTSREERKFNPFQIFSKKCNIPG